MRSPKIKIVKKDNGCRKVYVDGFEITGITNYEIKESAAMGNNINTTVTIGIYNPDVEIVNEDNDKESKEEIRQKKCIDININSDKIADLVIKSIDDKRRDSAKTPLII
ncbi:hypothetical protein KPL33_01130 [Clostridium algidicarnis]|uniref:hypothetical protein n=1 Tax=Clostridium algidicarnis TaxID=37659 RepID=UPI001C0D148D|nr:hypothetical protein [Clostridium algidicarnis]MBU3205581.1 hypothetical protein [Clostridium algidicarnis]